jgi:hypothetical protein
VVDIERDGMGQHPLDIARLQHLLQSAQEHLRSAEKQVTDTVFDSAKERTQFFEKLAIGSGATIAALVSFLGVHATRMQPVWILRCALVSLVFALVTAMYRNFRYPYYALAATERVRIEAMQYQQRCKNDLFQVDRSAVAIQTGRPIDLKQWTDDFNKSDAGLVTLIKEKKKREERLLAEVGWVERVCLVSICVAMIALVWLALRNF